MLITYLNISKQKKKSKIALVTGADHPTGLGAARALYKSGAEVLGIASNPESITCHSKVWKKIYEISSNGNLLSVLYSLIKNKDQSIFLMPTSDSHVSIISRYREELPEDYKFSLPDDAIVQTFLDKTQFYKWAIPLGLPLPQSKIVNNMTELKNALKEIHYPLILKPLLRTSSWNKVSPVRKGFKIGSAEDINCFPFDIFSVCSSFILSQWIEGSDDNVYYCLAYCGAPGKITKFYTGRKLLQYPRQDGSTAICVGVKNDEVLEITRKVFEYSNFKGLGSVEIKYDNKGAPFIIEPTVGRPNLQSYSAVAAGCNLQALAMDYALGRDSSHAKSSSKNCWWVEENAIFELITTSTSHPVPWCLLIKEMLRAHRLGGAFWDLKNPSVLVKLIFNKISRACRKVLS